MKRLLLGFILTLCFYLSGLSQNLNTKKLDEFFDSLERNNQVMGNFAVSKNGEIVYTRSIGFSSINGNETVKGNRETLYRIGSITKMFTATMIMQLIEEGKLSLSTTLDTYFPQIPNAKKITIEFMLRHRSGLYDYVNGPTDQEWIKKPQSKEAILEELTKNEPKFSPDKQFAYNNTGFYLLGRIIEIITGLSYNENLQQRICLKAKLNKTYSPPDNELKTNEANGYKFEEGKWVRVTDNYFPNIVGVGDILSSASDLIIFVEALIDGKLISQASLSQMKRFGGTNPFGLGIMKIPFKKKFGLGHRGDTFGQHAAVAKFDDGAITFASCINGTVFKPAEITIGILSICYEENYEIPKF